MAFINRLFTLSTGGQGALFLVPILLLLFDLSRGQTAEVKLRSAQTRPESERLMDGWTIRGRFKGKSPIPPYKNVERVTYERDGVVIYITYDTRQRVVGVAGEGWSY